MTLNELIDQMTENFELMETKTQSSSTSFSSINKAISSLKESILVAI